MARIIAHFMQEVESDAARDVMTNARETESFMLGECAEADIPRLEEQGVIVERIDEDPLEHAETPGLASTGGTVLASYGHVREMYEDAGHSLSTGPTIDFSGPNFYLIGLRGPLLEEWRREFDQIGVELLERVPLDSYTAKLTVEQVQQADSLHFVSGVRIYGPEDTRPVQRTRTASPPGVQEALIIYDARLHREADLQPVSDWLQQRGAIIAGASGTRLRFYLPEDPSFMDEIASHPEIAAMEPYVRPELHNDAARVLLGLDAPAASSVTSNMRQTGEGQIVAVADTGFDENHPDFQGRIAGISPLGRPNDYSDPHGHGTHVAGSVLGDGSASNGQIRGGAPEAELYFQSLLDANGDLGGLPMNLSDLFEEAYQQGARIHNNSWGAATNSAYTINATEVDEFVAEHRDMLIVISAGNEGQAASRVNSQQGFVDWLSVGSPATSKNALTIGASRSARTAGGFASVTYGQAWPAEFPDPPIANESVSGDPLALSAFSSRGPSNDRRIKPEVVAPGTDIVSTKSSRAPLRNFWGAYPGNRRYAFMGGTSMSAPLVSGCAALVREYYVKDRGHQPSAALMKATLINGTRWLTGPDSIADHPNSPNYHQGFGCVYMPSTIPNPSAPARKLEFMDPWKDLGQQFVRTGQARRYQFSCSGAASLRICLAWTDLPKRALQNDLDLTVMHRQSREKWVGNKDLPLRITALDIENNIELVRVDNPPAGDYLIQISATNLLGIPQDFALVVTGDLASPLVRV